MTIKLTLNFKQVIKITPRLYQLTAVSAHDTFVTLYTDPDVLQQDEADLWEQGGITFTKIEYADESIDGRVVWLKSEENI
jgi:hypothetical protein